MAEESDGINEVAEGHLGMVGTAVAQALQHAAYSRAGRDRHARDGAVQTADVGRELRAATDPGWWDHATGVDVARVEALGRAWSGVDPRIGRLHQRFRAALHTRHGIRIDTTATELPEPAAAALALEVDTARARSNQPATPEPTPDQQPASQPAAEAAPDATQAAVDAIARPDPAAADHGGVAAGDDLRAALGEALGDAGVPVQDAWWDTVGGDDLETIRSLGTADRGVDPNHGEGPRQWGSFCDELQRRWQLGIADPHLAANFEAAQARKLGALLGKMDAPGGWEQATGAEVASVQRLAHGRTLDTATARSYEWFTGTLSQRYGLPTPAGETPALLDWTTAQANEFDLRRHSSDPQAVAGARASLHQALTAVSGPAWWGQATATDIAAVQRLVDQWANARDFTAAPDAQDFTLARQYQTFCEELQARHGVWAAGYGGNYDALAEDIETPRLADWSDVYDLPLEAVDVDGLLDGEVDDLLADLPDGSMEQALAALGEDDMDDTRDPATADNASADADVADGTDETGERAQTPDVDAGLDLVGDDYDTPERRAQTARDMAAQGVDPEAIDVRMRIDLSCARPPYEAAVRPNASARRARVNRPQMGPRNPELGI